jgi:protoporphyrinogen oxidase
LGYENGADVSVEAGKANRTAAPPTAGAGRAGSHREATRVNEPQIEAGATDHNSLTPAVIAGAGPAGLTAAYELTRHGCPCVVLEADPTMVGGISRTDVYKGYRFDIGGHRFFSKSDEVNALWKDVLGDEFITRNRLSRIYYDGKFFDYPLRPLNALTGLGPLRSAQILASYLKARALPITPERSFEDWVVNRFGRKLFDIFFKTYTEKVWGMPTDEISADWAAQRIKGLSLTKAVAAALFGGLGKSKSKGQVIKTLIDRFQYPRLGPGQMWEMTRDRVVERGGAVVQDRRVVRVEHDRSKVTAFVAADSSGQEHAYRARHFLSTLPVRNLIRALDPPPPPAVLAAANALKYRDFLTVVLIVDQPETFPDNWIYVHEPQVKLGRVQNFKNWSPDLVPDPSRSSLGLEYFCFEGDDLWTRSDADLVALGRKEIDAIGLVQAERVVDGCVVRMPKAYPVYDDAYLDHLAVIRRWLGTLENLALAGRNGMHKYNNQDHSMMTALLCARNILGLGAYDPWNVNTDAEYHEEHHDDDRSGRAVPRPLGAGRRVGTRSNVT